MLNPEAYVTAYADLWSWMVVDEDWSNSSTPIISYLQNDGKSQSSNAKLLQAKLMLKLKAVTKNPSIGLVKTFNFQDYDYINQSITRTFIGKASLGDSGDYPIGFSPWCD